MLMTVITIIKCAKAYIFEHSNKLDHQSECEQNSKRLVNCPTPSQPCTVCGRLPPDVTTEAYGERFVLPQDLKQ